MRTATIPPAKGQEKPRTIEDLIGSHADEIAAAMGRFVGQAGGEADIRHEFYSLLRNFLAEAKIPVTARNEYELAGGRVDTKYGAVVVEYKNPHTNDRIDLKPGAASTRRLISQIQTRFRDFEKTEHIEQKRLFGCGTDGRNILFVRNRAGRIEVETPEPISPYAVGKLLRAIVSLGASGSSFMPETLCADFGASSEVAKSAVVALYDAIVRTKDEKAKTLFLQWKLLFSEVCGYNIDAPGKILAGLAQRFGIEKKLDGARFLFALHTYYSIFIKFMGSEIVAAFSLFTTSIIQRCNRTRTPEALRRVMLDLEKGANWKAWGVSNFLEGDLFAWYISAWSDAVAEAVRSIAIKADSYDPSTLSVDPAESQDLLKRLYQDLIPGKIRHDLGEYYTPDWLAEHLIGIVGFDGNPDTRVLDPGCGSGTFLVQIIAAAKNWFDAHRHECGFDERELARKILNNVVGFDLNPLAVMTSRVNYLIAIRDLIKYASHIEIPVYLSDSVLTPSAFGALFTNITQLKTAVGEFLIPAEVSRASWVIAKYTEIMEVAIDEKATADVFFAQCEAESLTISDRKVHRDLYAKMQQLSVENRNGIWARVIKNSFAPVFAERFDVVVGNPPWINWQNLPKDYRSDLLSIWKRYELFTLSGSAAGLGGSKKDLAMLFTYVSVDRYLKDGGRLGFVITQSVFKTKGAGDGFRRLRYESGRDTIYLRPVHVEDLSEVQVFDKATNRTALMVIEKSRRRFTYPIDCAIWRGAGRIPQDAALRKALDMTSRLDAIAEPVIVGQSTSPWLTVPRGTMAACRKVLGQSAYRAMAGCTTWLNGVYWVDVLRETDDRLTIRNQNTVGKTEGIEQIEASIEPDLVFPLIRGEDVIRWGATPSTHIIVPQDPETRAGIPEEELQRRLRRTFNYLERFYDPLVARSGYIKYFKGKGPFYSIYNVSEATFAPHKVMWRDMGFSPQAAVFSHGSEKAPIPEHHVMFIAAKSDDEAHFLCGILNSAPVSFAVAAYTTNTGMSTHVASVVALPRFRASNRDHQRMANLSKQAHEAVSAGATDLREIEVLIDAEAGQLFALTEADMKQVANGLNQLRN